MYCVQLIHRPIEPQVDVILLNRCIKSHIYDRLRFHGIDELHRACCQDKTTVVNDDVTAAQIDASQNHRVGRCTPYLKVRRSTNAESPADEVHVVR